MTLNKRMFGGVSRHFLASCSEGCGSAVLAAAFPKPVSVSRSRPGIRSHGPYHVLCHRAYFGVPPESSRVRPVSSSVALSGGSCWRMSCAVNRRHRGGPGSLLDRQRSQASAWMAASRQRLRHALPGDMRSPLCALAEIVLTFMS